jgi:LuxR family maltose regulon positive regulatory protein
LVLDDYHTIGLLAIHEAVAFLLDRMPPQMHIIMTSRSDPSLPLARLRVRGQLAEVRVADLRFTGQEAADLFDCVHEVRLSPDDVATLEARTEGWAAGLQLAALSLQQQDSAHIPTFLADFTGSHAYVFDYLADEVFQRQPDAVGTFLIQTAILSRLCGPLCAAVTGQSNTQALLEQLERANLFLIGLDSNRRWYRYHQLFRDFLRERLEQAVGPQGRALLHRRASAWFEQAGLIGEAIEHALSAGAWEDARRCIAPLTPDELMYEHVLDWTRWLAALPDAALRDDPDLCLRFTRVLMFIGQIDTAKRPLDLAEEVWRAAGNQAKLGEAQGWRAIMCYWRRDYHRAIAVAQQALADIPAQIAVPRGIFTMLLGLSELELGRIRAALDQLVDALAALERSSETFFTLATVLGLARSYLLQGKLHQAAGLCRETIQRGGGVLHRTGPAPYRDIGRLYYEWNELEVAERALQEGVTIGQQSGRSRFYPSLYSLLARMAWARGETALASSLFEQTLEAAQLLGNPRDIAEARAWQAWLWLAQGDLPAAQRWLAAHAPDSSAAGDYEHQAELLMLARIRIAEERRAPGSADAAGVVGLLERLLQAAVTDERVSDQIAILALLASAHAASRAPERAQELLGAALELAEGEGFVRTFVDEGEPVRALLLDRLAQLPDSAAAARQRAYIERLLAAFAPAASAPAAAAPPAPALLSDRERAILQLLASGRSIQDIATALIISVHTARTHVKHIYAKLDAHNRVEALDRARALQLL